MKVPTTRVNSNKEAMEKLRSIMLYVDRLDIASYKDESISLHNSRKSRALKTVNSNPAKLIDISLQEASFRSRLVTILIDLTQSRNVLNSAIDATTNYILLHSDVQGRTQTERKSMIAAKLSSAIAKLSELDSAISLVQLIIEDIEKMSWTLKRIAELMEISSKRDTVL